VLFAPGQQLDVAEQAVLAAPVAGGTRWRIIEGVKGHAVTRQVIGEPVDGADAAAKRAGRPQLLLRHEQWARWSSVGAIGAEYAGWLRQLAATGPGLDGRDVDWRGRMALVAPHLEDPEPLAALIAYGEIARAPYGALRPLKPASGREAGAAPGSSPSRSLRARRPRAACGGRRGGWPEPYFGRRRQSIGLR
jgi:hypothetical protein